jgi:hypothetical protein
MRWFRLRPTFSVVLQEPLGVVLDKIKSNFKAEGANENLLIYGEYGELHLPEREHRLWSPHLSWHIQEENDHCRLHGRFAPRVHVWSVVWIAYLLAVFSLFFALMIAWSQQFLGEYPWGYWIALASGLSWIGIYVVANIGQQLSADQMEHLRQDLMRRLEAADIRV